LGESNASVRKRFATLVKLIYGVRAHDTPERNYIRAFSKQMVLDLQQYGPYGKLKWRVPSDRLDSSSAREWLRSYFDGDGDVRVSSKLSKCKVRAKSVNRTGLVDVQVLLGKSFGVDAKLYRHGSPKFPKWSQSYDLEIIGAKNIKSFAIRIGFNHPIKKRKLARIMQIIEGRGLA
jgi:hypothetical protein